MPREFGQGQELSPTIAADQQAASSPVDQLKGAMSGIDNKDIIASLNDIIQKASESANAMGALDGIIRSLTADGKPLTDQFEKLVACFGQYESIVNRSASSTGSMYGNMAGLVKPVYEVSDGLSRMTSEMHSLNSIAAKLDLSSSFDAALPKINAVIDKIKQLQSMTMNGGVTINVNGTKAHVTGDVNKGSKENNVQNAGSFAKGGRVHYSSRNSSIAVSGGRFVGRKDGDREMAFVNAGEAILTEGALKRGAKQAGMSVGRYVNRLNSGDIGEIKKGRSFAEGTSPSRPGSEKKRRIGNAIQNQFGFNPNESNDKLEGYIKDIVEQLTKIEKNEHKDKSNEQMELATWLKGALSRSQNDPMKSGALAGLFKQQFGHSNLQQIVSGLNGGHSNDVQKLMNVKDDSEKIDRIFKGYENKILTVKDALKAVETKGLNDLERSMERTFGEGFGKLINDSEGGIGRLIKGFALLALSVKAVGDMAKWFQEQANLSIGFDKAAASARAWSDVSNESFQKTADNLNLTRKEMQEFGGIMSEMGKGAMNSGEVVTMMASNMKNAFGEVDMNALKEAVSIMKDLPTDQAMTLFGAGNFNSGANMLANLMKGGSAQIEKAADAQMKGAFGEHENMANISEADRQIIETNKEMVKLLDDMDAKIYSMTASVGKISQLANGLTSVVGRIGKGIGAVSSIFLGIRFLLNGGAIPVKEVGINGTTKGLSNLFNGKGNGTGNGLNIFNQIFSGKNAGGLSNLSGTAKAAGGAAKAAGGAAKVAGGAAKVAGGAANVAGGAASAGPIGAAITAAIVATLLAGAAGVGMSAGITKLVTNRRSARARKLNRESDLTKDSAMNMSMYGTSKLDGVVYDAKKEEAAILEQSNRQMMKFTVALGVAGAAVGAAFGPLGALIGGLVGGIGGMFLGNYIGKTQGRNSHYKKSIYHRDNSMDYYSDRNFLGNKRTHLEDTLFKNMKDGVIKDTLSGVGNFIADFSVLISPLATLGTLIKNWLERDKVQKNITDKDNEETKKRMEMAKEVHESNLEDTFKLSGVKGTKQEIDPKTGKLVTKYNYHDKWLTKEDLEKALKYNLKDMAKTIKRIENIEKGIYTEFAKQTSEANAANMESIRTLGGTNQSFAMNARSGFLNSKEVWDTKTDLLHTEKMKIINSNDSPEMKGNELNRIMTAELKAHKEYAESLSKFIGKVSELPGILERRFKEATSRSFMDFENSAFTSTGESALAGALESLRREKENASDTSRQTANEIKILKELQASADAMKNRANELREEVNKRFNEAKKKENPEWTEREYTEEDYEADQALVTKVDKEIAKSVDLDNNAEYQENDTKIEKMKDDQKDLAKDKYKDKDKFEKLLQQAEEMRESQAHAAEKKLNDLNALLKNYDPNSKEAKMIRTEISNLQYQKENLTDKSKNGVYARLEGIKNGKLDPGEMENVLAELESGNAAIAKAVGTQNIKERMRIMEANGGVDRVTGAQERVVLNTGANGASDMNVLYEKSKNDVMTKVLDNYKKISDTLTSRMKDIFHNGATEFASAISNALKGREAWNMMYSGKSSTQVVSESISAQIKDAFAGMQAVEDSRQYGAQAIQEMLSLEDEIGKVKFDDKDQEKDKNIREYALAMAAKNRAQANLMLNLNDPNAQNAYNEAERNVQLAGAKLDSADLENTVLKPFTSKMSTVSGALKVQMESTTQNMGKLMKLWEDIPKAIQGALQNDPLQAQYESSINALTASSEYLYKYVDYDEAVEAGGRALSEASLSMKNAMKIIEKTQQTLLQKTEEAYMAQIETADKALKADLEKANKESDAAKKQQLIDEAYRNHRSAVSGAEVERDKAINQTKASAAQAKTAEMDKYQQRINNVYDKKEKHASRIEESLGIQKDVLNTIGAPFEFILQTEKDIIKIAREKARIEENRLAEMIQKNESSEAIEEQKLKVQKAQANVLKAAFGAQRDSLDKMLGKMMGTFQEIGGIFSIDSDRMNAKKYGQGYGINENGMAFEAGKNAHNGFMERRDRNAAIANGAGVAPTGVGDVGQGLSGNGMGDLVNGIRMNAADISSKEGHAEGRIPDDKTIRTPKRNRRKSSVSKNPNMSFSDIVEQDGKKFKDKKGNTRNRSNRDTKQIVTKDKNGNMSVAYVGPEEYIIKNNGANESANRFGVPKSGMMQALNQGKLPDYLETYSPAFDDNKELAYVPIWKAKANELTHAPRFNRVQPKEEVEPTGQSLSEPMHVYKPRAEKINPIKDLQYESSDGNAGQIEPLYMPKVEKRGYSTERNIGPALYDANLKQTYKPKQVGPKLTGPKLTGPKPASLQQANLLKNAASSPAQGNVQGTSAAPQATEEQQPQNKAENENKLNDSDVIKVFVVNAADIYGPIVEAIEKNSLQGMFDFVKKQSKDKVNDLMKIAPYVTNPLKIGPAVVKSLNKQNPVKAGNKRSNEGSPFPFMDGISKLFAKERSENQLSEQQRGTYFQNLTNVNDKLRVKKPAGFANGKVTGIVDSGLADVNDTSTGNALNSLIGGTMSYFDIVKNYGRTFINEEGTLEYRSNKDTNTVAMEDENGHLSLGLIKYDEDIITSTGSNKSASGLGVPRTDMMQALNEGNLRNYLSGNSPVFGGNVQGNANGRVSVVGYDAGRTSTTISNLGPDEGDEGSAENTSSSSNSAQGGGGGTGGGGAGVVKTYVVNASDASKPVVDELKKKDDTSSAMDKLLNSTQFFSNMSESDYSNGGIGWTGKSKQMMDRLRGMGGKRKIGWNGRSAGMAGTEWNGRSADFSSSDSFLGHANGKVGGSMLEDAVLSHRKKYVDLPYDYIVENYGKTFINENGEREYRSRDDTRLMSFAGGGNAENASAAFVTPQEDIITSTGSNKSASGFGVPRAGMMQALNQGKLRDYLESYSPLLGSIKGKSKGMVNIAGYHHGDDFRWSPPRGQRNKTSAPANTGTKEKGSSPGFFGRIFGKSPSVDAPAKAPIDDHGLTPELIEKIEVDEVVASSNANTNADKAAADAETKAAQERAKAEKAAKEASEARATAEEAAAEAARQREKDEVEANNSSRNGTQGARRNPEDLPLPANNDEVMANILAGMEEAKNGTSKAKDKPESQKIQPPSDNAERIVKAAEGVAEAAQALDLPVPEEAQDILEHQNDVDVMEAPQIDTPQPAPPPAAPAPQPAPPEPLNIEPVDLSKPAPWMPPSEPEQEQEDKPSQPPPQTEKQRRESINRHLDRLIENGVTAESSPTAWGYMTYDDPTYQRQRNKNAKHILSSAEKAAINRRIQTDEDGNQYIQATAAGAKTLLDNGYSNDMIRIVENIDDEELFYNSLLRAKGGTNKRVTNRDIHAVTEMEREKLEKERAEKESKRKEAERKKQEKENREKEKAENERKRNEKEKASVNDLKSKTEKILPGFFDDNNRFEKEGTAGSEGKKLFEREVARQEYADAHEGDDTGFWEERAAEQRAYYETHRIRDPRTGKIRTVTGEQLKEQHIKDVEHHLSQHSKADEEGHTKTTYEDFENAVGDFRGQNPANPIERLDPKDLPKPVQENMKTDKNQIAFLLHRQSKTTDETRKEMLGKQIDQSIMHYYKNYVNPNFKYKLDEKGNAVKDENGNLVLDGYDTNSDEYKLIMADFKNFEKGFRDNLEGNNHAYEDAQAEAQRHKDAINSKDNMKEMVNLRSSQIREYRQTVNGNRSRVRTYDDPYAAESRGELVDGKYVEDDKNVKELTDLIEQYYLNSTQTNKEEYNALLERTRKKHGHEGEASVQREFRKELRRKFDLEHVQIKKNSPYLQGKIYSEEERQEQFNRIQGLRKNMLLPPSPGAGNGQGASIQNNNQNPPQATADNTSYPNTEINPTEIRSEINDDQLPSTSVASNDENRLFTPTTVSGRNNSPLPRYQEEQARTPEYQPNELQASNRGPYPGIGYGQDSEAGDQGAGGGPSRGNIKQNMNGDNLVVTFTLPNFRNANGGNTNLTMDDLANPNRVYTFNA